LAVSTLIVTDSPLSEVQVKRWRYGVLTEASDQVAEETPIALIYNGVSHAVMLATPQDLEDFALGFSLSEGILQDKSELYDCEIVAQSEGIELRMEIASECFVRLKEKRRNLVGRTGCGLCGAESLAQALRLPIKHKSTQEKMREKNYALEGSIHKASRASIAMASIQRTFSNMQKQQLLQQATGATHACAWVNEAGEIALLREDVGRHNAMDKLIGALAKAPQETKETQENTGFVLTSSRASYEMVQKVAQAGLQILVAISAPTGLAIRLADIYGVTLVGFLREHQCVVYTHANKIELDNLL
jgi:FdhD protein